MPLHLLGKKSWNVYNADNIARVRRDEAAAKAKEEAEEQRMQEVDAERRLAILRGEEPPPLPPTEETPDDEPRHRDRDAGSFGRERKKRKRAGEDDTDFELRVARERSGVLQTANETLRKSTSSAPIVDAAGHIDLFGEERKQGRHLKNEEAEKEAAKRKKEMEDQYTMRLSNAAGKDGMVGPWYAASGSRAELAELEPAGKDAFGNEDPERKKRDEQRIVANDPLAMMKMGASRVREVKKERQRFEAERQRELEQLRKEEKRKEKHERRKREHRRNEERHPRERSREKDDGEARSLSRRESERHPRSSREDERRRSRDRHQEERNHRHERRDESDRRSRRDERSRHEGRDEKKHERGKRDSDSRHRDDHRRSGEP
ncbi:blastn match against entry EMBL [Colletotrichum cuscutae]|uniref:Blastn match against entry EMBL n=1 Tax=Colletotrichum cuscutae TaxID=1209917 RepID=A0AAI9XKH2_9PEZI|nr:blastn match against entry EMBL [Colletotrichum cuscutae]